jgi:hypothetical protein
MLQGKFRKIIIALILAVCGTGVFPVLSCYDGLDDSFQQLEGVSPEGVKVVEITGATTAGAQEIYKNNAVAQQFTPNKKYILYEVRIVLSRVGSFLDEDKLKVAFCYDSSDNPGAASGYYAYDVKLNAISAERSEHIFVFNNRPTVQAGTKYWIKVYFANTDIGDASNCILFYHTDSDAYPGNYLKIYNGSSWSKVSNADLGITIWGKEQL